MKNNEKDLDIKTQNANKSNNNSDFKNNLYNCILVIIAILILILVYISLGNKVNLDSLNSQQEQKQDTLTKAEEPNLDISEFFKGEVTNIREFIKDNDFNENIQSGDGYSSLVLSNHNYISLTGTDNDKDEDEDEDIDIDLINNTPITVSMFDSKYGNIWTRTIFEKGYSNYNELSIIELPDKSVFFGIEFTCNSSNKTKLKFYKYSFEGDLILTIDNISNQSRIVGMYPYDNNSFIILQERSNKTQTLKRLDFNGNELFSYVAKGDITNVYTDTSANRLILSIDMDSTKEYYRTNLIELNNQGKVIRKETIDYVDSAYISTEYLAIDDFKKVSDGYIAVASSPDETIFIKLDKSLKHQWVFKLEGDLTDSSKVLELDNQYILLTTSFHYNDSTEDEFVILDHINAIDKNGKLLWTKAIGDINYDGYSANNYYATIENNRVHIHGIFYEEYKNSIYDIFIDSDGNLSKE